MTDDSIECSYEDSFQNFLKSLGEKSAATLRCFDRGDYFTLHGEDAELVARDYFKTSAALKYFKKGSQSWCYVIVKKAAIDNFFKYFLLKHQYRVEVYISKTKSGKDNVWSVQFKASPGNLSQFEDVLFTNVQMEESSGLMALNVTQENGQKVISLAVCEQGERRLAVTQFMDSDLLTNLESALVQSGCRECLMPSDLGSADLAQARQTLERAGLLISEQKKSNFIAKDIEQDLTRLLKKIKKAEGRSITACYPEIEQLPTAMGCLSAIIAFLQLTGDECNFNSFSLGRLSLDNYVRLDTSAIRALNLLPASTDTNRYQSVYGVLNNCRTPQGQRLLAQWIKQPLMDIRKINERLDLVEALVTDSDLRQALHEDLLRRVPDLQRLAKKLQRSKANLQDCFRVYQTVSKLDNLVDILSRHAGPHAHIVNEVFTNAVKELQESFCKYQEMMESTIDMEAVNQHEFLVKPSFDEQLTELREQLDDVEGNINDQFLKAAKKLNMDPKKTVKLDVNQLIGYHMRVTKKEEKALRDFKSFHIVDTQKNGVRFRNEAMTELNDRFMELKADYAEHQQSIVAEIVKIAAGYLEPLHQLNALLAILDVITSFSVTVVTAPGVYTRPQLLEKGQGRIELSQARHPCVEAQEEVSFIPNDVHFGKGQTMFHIITGPNMGGKSTYIRGVGVIVLMAQLGSFVPCESAVVSVVDSVMARVGASDCQVKGVSTFMAEMLETAAILRTATSDSLLIIDELGRGTSTYDGFGLAWSISEWIARELGSFCLFATHFHELTQLANDLDTVTNAHVTARTEEGQLVLLYQVKQGVCDQSFGIHVAELAHLPPTVVEFAREKARDYESLQWLEEKPEGPPPIKVARTNSKPHLDEIKKEIRKFRDLPVNKMTEEKFNEFKADIKRSIQTNPQLAKLCDTLVAKP